MSAQRKKKVILITGASTGIGLALGRKLMGDEKYHVVLTARHASLSRFDDAGVKTGPNVWIRPLDILSKKQRDALVKEIDVELGGVDVLVNNAGYMLTAVVEHVGEEERLKQVDTNFRAPLSLIRAVLPKMREKQSGHIINISSVGGMMAMPTMAIYSASKFALEGATEALWYEVKPWNIRVNLVQPGFVNSDGFEKAIRSRQSNRAVQFPHTDYFYQYSGMAPFVAKLMRRTRATPETVALKIFKLIEERSAPLRVAGTWDARFFSLLRRLLPQRVYFWIFWLMLPSEMRKPGISLRCLKIPRSLEFVEGSSEKKCSNPKEGPSRLTLNSNSAGT